MQEVNINTLVTKKCLLDGDHTLSDIFTFNYLHKNIPNNIKIVGKIRSLNINYDYDKLDLSEVDCRTILCEGNISSLPKLPHSLEILDCSDNNLTSFSNVQLPNSLKELHCMENKLKYLPKLPNSLEKLLCGDNQLTYFDPLKFIKNIILL